MFEYEWANPPSTTMISSEGIVQESSQNRQIFYPYSATQTAAETATFFNPNPYFTTTATSHHQHQHQHPFHHTEALNSNTQLTNLYDSRVYGRASASSYPAEASMLGLEPDDPTGFTLMPKSEPVVGRVDINSSASRIGLNLGGRTYFASSEDDSVNRLYRRFRAVEPGLVNSPRCQAEGCNANLAHAKHYHRRHKVCEFHSKASMVITAGLTQRFCQQCSRFHMLSEFDNGKRSCRKRLADHNRRRRKSQISNQELISKSQHDNAGRDSSSENLTRSPSDSGVHSSSVNVAISSPSISLDCFRQRSSFQGATTISSTASTSSLFFTKR